MRNIWPARFCPLRVPLHRTRPPLISLSGHRFNQEIKWGAVGHRLATPRPTSLNRGSTDVSTPGTWVTSTPNSLYASVLRSNPVAGSPRLFRFLDAFRFRFRSAGNGFCPGSPRVSHAPNSLSMPLIHLGY